MSGNIPTNHKNMEVQSFNMEVHSNTFTQTDIVHILFDKLSISTSDNIKQEDLSCEAVVGLIDARLRDELRFLCMQSECYYKLIAQQEIFNATKKLDEKIDYYTSISDLCTNLYNQISSSSIFDEKSITCPVDNTLEIRNGVLWINNISANMLVWNTPICDTQDLLSALYCKFSRFSHVCYQIKEERSRISNDNIECLKRFKNYQDEYMCCICTSAQRNIDEQTSPAKKKKYPDVVLNRMKRNPLYDLYDLYEYNKPEFCHYVATTEGISSAHVFDFLVDYTIIQSMKITSLSYPWLKNEYANRVEDIKLMLIEAYRTCTSKGFRLTPSQAYTLLWFWLLTCLKISVSGITNGISMFTELMNRITGESVQASTMKKEISNGRKQNYSEYFSILRIFSIKYQFETL